MITQKRASTICGVAILERRNKYRYADDRRNSMSSGRSKIRLYGTQYIRNRGMLGTQPVERLITLNLEPTQGAAAVGFITFTDAQAASSLGSIRIENNLTILDCIAFERDFDLIYTILKDPSDTLDIVWTSDDSDNTLVDWAILKESHSGLEP